ncbi:MAG: DUF4340 domain-containing protein [Chloroflexi bacterium]|nr:DUF4340 domain-containing protein [Chloroflexota bacterium]
MRNILILLVILLALGGYFYFTNRPGPPPPPETRLFVWLVEMEDIERIEIQLPRQDKSQAFAKEKRGDEFPWYFDDPQRSAVDMKRWGGGIPLLLSGPAANRVIAENTTEEKLAEFGLTQPQMKIALTLENGEEVSIIVGDRTPDGKAFYVKAPDTNDVALVDYTWYEVLERLVKEPPYALPSAD